MAIATGKGGVVKIDEATETFGATTVVANMRSFSIETTSDTIEATNMDSTDREYLKSGLTSSTVSIECYWDEGAGQLLLDAGESLDLEISPQGTGSGRKHYDCTGIVTSKSISTSFDGMVEASFSVQVNGGVTEDAHQ